MCFFFLPDRVVFSLRLEAKAELLSFHFVVVWASLAAIIMGFMLKKPDDAAGSAWPAIAVGMFVAFGGILFGYVVRTEITCLADNSF